MKDKKYHTIEIEEMEINDNFDINSSLKNVEKTKTNDEPADLSFFSENIKTEQQEQKKNKRSRIPKKEIEIYTVLRILLPQWDEKKLPLLWTNKQEIQQIFDEYDKQLHLLSQDSGQKRPFVQRLKELDKQINKNISKVKFAITAKWGRELKNSYFSQFGLIKKHTYSMPLNREDRLKSLKVLVNAISKEENFILYDCDLQYWQNILNEYSQLYEQSIVRTGNISQIVGQKNMNKKLLIKFLNSFIKIVKGNYPDTWKNELRNFGFQRERY